MTNDKYKDEFVEVYSWKINAIACPIITVWLTISSASYFPLNASFAAPFNPNS